MQFAKAVVLAAFLRFSGSLALTNEVRTKKIASQDRTITKVVKKLQEMMKLSKETQDEEEKTYGLFVCECNKRDKELKDTIASETSIIAGLSNKLEGLQAVTGVLDAQSSDLEEDIGDNTVARENAAEVRDKEKKTFEATEKDLKQAIAMLGEALNTLAAVSADQTDSDGAQDHKKFMAGYKGSVPLSASFLRARSSLNKAVLAATAFMDDKTAQKVTAFVQAPFTGSYTAQSVEIMGILKNLMDTFESNLQKAREAEAASQAAFDKLDHTKLDEKKTLDVGYDKTQNNLAVTDADRRVKRTTREGDRTLLKQAEADLDLNTRRCDEMKETYSHRRVLQTEEQAAIAQAISILDSDDAFSIFGTVTATKEGSTGPVRFLQHASIQKHSQAQAALRSKLMLTLQKAKGSKRLAKLASMVKAASVFGPVLAEIDKMIKVIDVEGAADEKNLAFCNEERATKFQFIEDQKEKIDANLDTAIAAKTSAINHRETGLKAQVAKNQASLMVKEEEITTETANRDKAHAAYLEEKKNLKDARAILAKAIGVLNAYYAKHKEEIAKYEAGLLQKLVTSKKSSSKKSMPDPDDKDWKAEQHLSMEGQSEMGADVLGMLRHIADQTELEEKHADEDEETSVQNYEEAISDLKGDEANLQEGIVNLAESLAQAEKELAEKIGDKTATKAEIASAEQYLASIKSGCDFITENKQHRDEQRKVEKETLEKAIDLLKATPEYVEYKSATYTASLGDCASLCEPESNYGTAKCQACLGKVTVAGYCASNPSTPGC